MNEQTMTEQARENGGYLPCTAHWRKLNAAMSGTMTGPLTEDTYADLLNISYAMYNDLSIAQRRICDLEKRLSV